MRKVVAVRKTFREADLADKEYYQSLSPQQRLEILLELNRRWPVPDDVEAAEGLARVYRIVRLP
jgi:hypothetical protein